MTYPMTGRVLVALQFGFCFALIAVGGGEWVRQPWLWPLAALGIVVAALGVRAMRAATGTLKMTPAPAAGTKLCECGIYRYIRHPMYAGQLLGLATFALVCDSPGLGWGLWLGLLLVLMAKMRIEETLLAEQIADFPDYMRRTKRLVPLLW